MEIDRNGLEVLERPECLRLLAQCTLGRVAVTDRALPTVLPVTFRLVDERILFRTGSGTKLEAAATGAVVAFEVDDMDPVSHTGWSVVVTGVAEEITDPADLAALEDAHLPRWAPGRGDNVVAVSTERVTGRRITSLPLLRLLDRS